jgi:hypothetical protein
MKMAVDNVAAGNFYKDDGDKTKGNWFLYEYSNILFTKIDESAELSRYKRRHDKEDISAFCTYFSKRLRWSIFNAHTRKTEGVVIDARYVYEFYPENSRAQTQRLLEVAISAWSEHLMVCTNCPNQCLKDGYERTDMFDNLERTGWPTV